MKPTSEQYYDDFSANYERHRHHGYHRLLDDLEVDLALRHSSGLVLEAGCGTGLILERIARDRPGSQGFDLSLGMLRGAQRRRLVVSQASVTDLPFPNEAFDTVVSFKVLAHIPNIERAVSEFARVTRPGGTLILEFYNRWSLRYLQKRLKPASPIGTAFTDEDVFTRFDSLDTVRSYLTPDLAIEAIHGVRVLTPFAQAHNLPILAPLLSRLEWAARDLPILRHLGGFLVVVARKTDR
ncbi:MAG: class I SAM-dependent methyltransferase [Deltaproteobacteria bacterium]|nr:class I SAM-dependent methyltransferase [Deltaproteobacteria bacterium]